MKTARLRSFLLAVTLATGLFAADRASAQINYVQNPSFEATQYAADSLNEVSGGTTDGWYYNKIGTNNNHEYVINGDVQLPDGDYVGNTSFGSQYVGLNAIYRNSFHSIASQSVSGLTAGQAYMLTIYIANLDGASDPNIGLTVEYNATGTGTPAVSTTFAAPAGSAGGPAGQGGTINFVPFSVTFVPTSNVIDFNINNQSKTGVMGIDNVSLVAVPEPGPVAAVLMGAAGMAAVVLRRRRVQ